METIDFSFTDSFYWEDPLSVDFGWNYEENYIPCQELEKKGRKRVNQRHAANLRERKRMRTINDAFEGLRARVPAADKKLSKVDTLRLAVRYIQHLANIVESCGGTNNKKQKKTETNGKVILRCSQYQQVQAGEYPLSSVYGHSLSWTSEKEIEEDHFSERKKSATLWIPEQLCPEEQAELSSQSLRA